MKLLCNSIKILEDRVEIHGPFIMQKIKEGERMVFIAEYEGSVKGRKRTIASTFFHPLISAIIVSHYTQSKKFSTELF